MQVREAGNININHCLYTVKLFASGVGQFNQSIDLIRKHQTIIFAHSLTLK